ncbi:pimeloyl-ACP methyl ester carboxylesterase [Rhizobium sp. BIGb0125]|nr:pimeloyl-ACP methyl ester carboxylesterase [Rhizobium sp. BIGb0125]
MKRRAFVIGFAAISSLKTSALSGEVFGKTQNNEVEMFDVIKQIDAGVLNVGYYEGGAQASPTVVLLHGFPYDVQSYREVAPELVRQGYRVIVPHLRGHGTTSFLDTSTPRSGQQAAIGADLIHLLDALSIDRAIFAGYDWGGRAACVAAALWPERCSGLVSVNGYLIQNISKAIEPLSAKVERGYWYQFYFQTERGRRGLERNRAEIANIMWRENSPTWRFTNETFERSATSFNNADYVDVVIHSYRHRLGGAAGYELYEDIEVRLAKQPPITVPTVTLDGGADGVVAATDGTASAAKFLAKRVHHVVPGVGHNLPQEAPEDFVDAVLEVAAL